MTGQLRGLRNYRVIPAPPAALQAVANLRARGWMTFVDKRCACGNEFTPAGSIICFRCRKAGRCTHKPLPGYVIQQDGTCVARQRCGLCGSSDLPPLPRGSTIYDICFKDHREEKQIPPCERCGGTDGCQVHHWGPSAIFGDSGEWPTSWLCIPCHSAWHAAMRKAGGVSLPARERVLSPNASEDDIRRWRRELQWHERDRLLRLWPDMTAEQRLRWYELHSDGDR